MQVIGRFAPLQHNYSIDESFLSFKNCNEAISDLPLHAQAIRRAVWKETRLPVCVGIGNTLTLAKVANHVAKKWASFNGVCVLDNEDFKQTIFNQLTPIDIWGVGKKTDEKLKQNGVLTALQLSHVNTKYLPVGFNVELERTIKELNGEACKTWDAVRADKLQIFSSRSLGKRITHIEELHQALAKHVGIAALKARGQKSLCGSLMAFATNSPFDTNPCSYKILKQFNPPTNDTSLLLKAVSENIHQLYKPGVAYYKIGIGLLNLSCEANQQGDLFFPSADNVPLMNVLDQINRRYGRDTSFFAAQGIVGNWSMRRELLSPQYTTNWRDIPKITC